MTHKSNPKNVTVLIERAIAFAGSEAKLGTMIGKSQNAIWSAKRKGRVSAEIAAGIDRITNGTISKSDLRPDIFPQPQLAQVVP